MENHGVTPPPRGRHPGLREDPPCWDSWIRAILVPDRCTWPHWQLHWRCFFSQFQWKWPDLEKLQENTCRIQPGKEVGSCLLSAKIPVEDLLSNPPFWLKIKCYKVNMPTRMTSAVLWRGKKNCVLLGFLFMAWITVTLVIWLFSSWFNVPGSVTGSCKRRGQALWPVVWHWKDNGGEGI